MGFCLSTGSQPLHWFSNHYRAHLDLPFSTAVVMLLGANVGSTLAVQLLSYRVTEYALYVVGLFALLALCTAHTPCRRVGQALFACGLMLLGLFTLSQAGQLLASSPWVVGILHTYASRPFLLLFFFSTLPDQLSFFATQPFLARFL